MIPASPSSIPRPELRAARAPGKLIIDGKLDDAPWSAAVAATAFTQHFPDEGAPPSEPTSVRVLYDDDAIYVGVDCTQLHAPVVRRLMRRDRDLPSDGVWIDIDSRNDGLSAFHFGVNAAGVLNDGVHFNDVGFSRDWDGNWRGKVALTDHGYSVEIRIPLGDLRFQRLPVQEWGFQARRFIDARQETDDWSFFPRGAAGVVSRFGRLTGLIDLRPGSRIELRPFELGRLRHRDADVAAALAHGTDAHVSGGIDVKAHLTPELTLDGSVLPDFGQVEADTLVLNLSTYETFFPEKRRFFLEGIDIFATMRTLLYTRRVGRQPAAPALAAAPGTREALVDAPDPSSIWGAVKLVGRIGKSTTVGLLSALTGPNRVGVEVTDAAGAVARPRRLVDPLTVFQVARVRRSTGPTSEAGVLFTATNRFEPAGVLCPATGVAAPPSAGRCLNDAYTGSADVRWRSPAGDYLLATQAVGSLLQRGGARPQADGYSILPGRLAPGATLWATKQGGAHWLWSLGQHLSGRRLELNDLGYLDRKNDYNGSLDVSYRTIEPWRGTVETRSTLQLRYRETLDGLNLYSAVELNTWWTAANFWSFYAEVHYRGARFDDRETGDGTALERAGLWGVEGSLSTDPRARVVASGFGQAHRISNGTHWEARGQITLRLRPQLDLDLLPSLVYQSGEPRYLSTAAPDALGAVTYSFARQLARNVGATLRASYTFTPELTLQAYAQLFLVAEHFSDFSTFTAGAPGQRARVRLGDLVAAPPPAANPDVQQAALNLNVVLRWEFRLGSTLYLVYSRAQAPPATLLPGEEAALDLRPVLRGRSSVDVLMLKISYWFG
ncbi:MAG TPA: DUF5916 domain-containing protein [Polyangia bacterium]|nr:DUF5916 domain-containing protein [Polyangia bacterium]